MRRLGGLLRHLPCGLRCNEIGNKVLMGISHHPAHAGKSGNFIRRSLGVATGNKDSRAGVFALNLSYRGTSVMIRRRGHGTGVQDYNISVSHGFSTRQPLLLELLLQSCAVSLRGAAAKVLHNESGHSSIIMVRYL